MSRFNSLSRIGLSLWLLATASFLGSVGCGDSSDSSTEDSKSATSTEVLGKAGGSISVASASLTVPSGALAKDTKITVGALSKKQIAELPSLPAGTSITGTPTRCTPHGLSFSKPVTVELTHTSKSSKLKVVKLANDTDRSWTVLETVKQGSGTVSFETKSFSIYAAVEDPEDLLVPGELPDSSSNLGGASGTGGTGSTGADLPVYTALGIQGTVSVEMSAGSEMSPLLKSEAEVQCVSATGTAAATDTLTLTYQLAQVDASSEASTRPKTYDGYFFRTSLPSAEKTAVQSARLILTTGDDKTYCHDYSLQSDARFVDWGGFVLCSDDSVSLPEDATLKTLQFVFPANAVQDQEICVKRLHEDRSNYLEAGDFYGIVEAIGSNGSVAPGTSNWMETPACVNVGFTTDGSGSLYSGVRWSVRQKREDSKPSLYVPTLPSAGGFKLTYSSITSNKGTIAPILYALDDSGNYYCYPLKASANDGALVTELVSWGKFQSGCAGSAMVSAPTKGFSYMMLVYQTTVNSAKDQAVTGTLCLSEAGESALPQ